jgi:hypothetical protein
MTRSTSTKLPSRRRGHATQPVLVAAFLVLAVGFWIAPARLAVPGAPTPAVDPQALAMVALRAPRLDAPAMDVAGISMPCTECHALFESPPVQKSPLAQHQDVVLDHGLNSRCLNCHARRDRSKLVLHGEVEVAFTEVVQVCAQCHGPTFRDWEKGVHGKTLGSWETGSAGQRRLGCVECHDPHRPALPDLVPLPGPHTLRMGEPGRPASGPEDDPLRRAFPEARR